MKTLFAAVAILLLAEASCFHLSSSNVKTSKLRAFKTHFTELAVPTGRGVSMVDLTPLIVKGESEVLSIQKPNH